MLDWRGVVCRGGMGEGMGGEEGVRAEEGGG